MNIVAFVHRSTSTTPLQPVINCQSLSISDLLVPPVRGDVTGDGKVDIADVNAVINIMLGKTVTSDELLVTSDVTGDGTVDIADVNAVINIMLGKTVTSDELLATSDVTGDGKVDIADVNAVINIMLGK